jgi:hypothetical protein
MYLDALGECAQMVAAIAATIQAHPLAGRLGEGVQHIRRDTAVGGAVEQCVCAVRVGSGLIAGSWTPAKTWYFGADRGERG